MRQDTFIVHRAFATLVQDANRMTTILASRAFIALTSLLFEARWSIGFARRTYPSLQAFFCFPLKDHEQHRGLAERSRLRPRVPFSVTVVGTSALSLLCIVVFEGAGFSARARAVPDPLVTLSLFCATHARTVSCCSSSVVLAFAMSHVFLSGLLLQVIVHQILQLGGTVGFVSLYKILQVQHHSSIDLFRLFMVSKMQAVTNIFFWHVRQQGLVPICIEFSKIVTLQVHAQKR